VATVFRPPITTRNPLRPVQPPADPGNLLITTLAGKDNVLRRQWDWPNPVLRADRAAVENRTWLQRGEHGPLRGKDNVLLGRLLDWPNPTLRQDRAATENRTWLHEGGQKLLKDKFFGVAGQPPADLDWPVPKGAARANSLLSSDADNSWLPLRFLFVQPPFSQDDWPNPVHRTTASRELLSWALAPTIAGLTYFARDALITRMWAASPWAAILSQLPMDLLNTTLVPSVITPAPFSLEDWPNPRGASPVVTLRTWTDIYRAHLFREAIPELNLDWPVPKGALGSISLRTWSEGYKSQLFQEAIPELNLDWPNPRGPEWTRDLRTFTNSIEIQLSGQDQFFGAPGQPPANTDWAVPRGPARAVSLLSYDALAWLPLRVVIVAPPFFQMDWPNPRGSEWPRDLRSFLRAMQLGLPGQDNLPPFDYDWPNPRGPQRAVDLLSWAQNLQQTTLNPIIIAPPFFLMDWPNPRGAAAAVALRTWAEGYKAQLFREAIPSLNFDWPVPKGPTGSVSLRTWAVDAFKLGLLGQDNLPPFVYDWPNPRGPRPVLDTLGWLQNLQTATLGLVFVQPPFYQTDWPTPRGAEWHRDLRTWVRWSPLGLVGARPFPNYDWPVPRGAQGGVELRTWLQNLSQSTLAPIIYPFNLLDWPNPRGAQAAVALRTWIDALRQQLLGRDNLLIRQSDWPLPHRPVVRRQDFQSGLALVYLAVAKKPGLMDRVVLLYGADGRPATLLGSDGRALRLVGDDPRPTRLTGDDTRPSKLTGDDNRPPKLTGPESSS
jgi:hypothetical protein